MEWLPRSIGEDMCEGRLPDVPEARKLEESLFPVRLHPRHASLEEEFFMWARSFLGSSEKEMEKMHRRSIASLPCYLWPTTSQPQRSLTLIKLMHWFTLVDEAVDEGAGLRGDVEEVERLCKGLVQELLGTTTAQAQLHEKPLVVTVGCQWWEGVRQADMPREKKARLAAELTDFLMAQVEITRFRADLLNSRKPPTVEEYITTRRLASAFPLGLAMIEYDMGDCMHELDEETLNSPLLQQLRDAVSDQASWLNDIISFPKEFGQGDFLSLLPLLHIRNNAHCPDFTSNELVPFRVAVAQAWEMTTAREQECARLAHQILHSPHLAGKPGLHEYVEAVCGFTSGNWAWSLECPAYNLHSLSHDRKLISLGAPQAFPAYKYDSSHDQKVMINLRARQASLLLRKPPTCFVSRKLRQVINTSRVLQLPPSLRFKNAPTVILM